MNNTEKLIDVIGDFSSILTKYTAIEDFLDSSAFSIANAICPGNEQFVVMEIDEEDQEYTIIRALPRFSERHSLWHVGQLKEPSSKLALIEAIEDRQVVVIQDARTDPKVEYMREHVINKDILSLAILPIVVNKTYWLIVIDKVSPTPAGFSSEEVIYLKRFSEIISNNAFQLLKNGKSRTDDDCRAKLTTLSCLQDLIGIPLATSFGYMYRIVKEAKKIAKKAGVSCKEIDRLWDIASQDGKRMEEELSLMVRFMNHLSKDGDQLEKITIHKLVSTFKEDRVQVDFPTNRKIQSCVEMLQTAFERLKNYIGKEEFFLNVTIADGKFIFRISSYVFQPFKLDKDIKLYLIRSIFEKLHATFTLEKGTCIIVLPQKYIHITP